MKDRVDKNLVKENDNIRKYMQQIKVDGSSLFWKKKITIVNLTRVESLRRFCWRRWTGPWRPQGRPRRR